MEATTCRGSSQQGSPDGRVFFSGTVGGGHGWKIHTSSRASRVQRHRNPRALNGPCEDAASWALDGTCKGVPSGDWMGPARALRHGPRMSPARALPTGSWMGPCKDTPSGSCVKLYGISKEVVWVQGHFEMGESVGPRLIYSPGFAVRAELKASKLLEPGDVGLSGFVM